MTQNKTTSGGLDTDLAWLIVAGAGILLLRQVWNTRLRPWATDTWAALTSEAATTPVVAGMDRTDLVGLAVLGIPFLLALAVAATTMRRRRHKHPKAPDA